MIDRESHSLLNASHRVLPTEEYIYSITDQTEIEHLIDRLKRLRKLYLHDGRLHGEIDKLYNAAIGRDFHLHRQLEMGRPGVTPSQNQPQSVSKAVSLLDSMISKADGEGTFRGGKDPSELQQMREEKRQEQVDAGEDDVEKSESEESEEPKTASQRRRMHQDIANTLINFHIHSNRGDHDKAKEHMDRATSLIKVAGVPKSGMFKQHIEAFKHESHSYGKEYTQAATQAKNTAAYWHGDVSKGYPSRVNHSDMALQHKGQATYHDKMANNHFESWIVASHQKAADSHVAAIKAHNKAAKNPKFADQARAATEQAYSDSSAAEQSHGPVIKSDRNPGEEQGSFRGGDPEELQRKREEKRQEQIESGQVDDQDQSDDAGEEPDPAQEQAEQEKKEQAQFKSMGVDMGHGVGTGQRSAEVSPVDTFGDYSPRNANGDPVYLKDHEQGYFPPGPIRRGKNQWKDWSEVIGIKVPMVAPIQELRRYFGRGDSEGAQRASAMMPKSLIDGMIKALEAPPAGAIPSAGAEGRARGGKYVKREFRNGRWDYTYQDDMHANHGVSHVNNPEGHSLAVHSEFKGGTPDQAFHHAFHMHAAEGGDHPIKLWNDETNQHEDKILHFPGAEKDEEGKHVIDKETSMPKLDDRKTAIIRNPGQKGGGDRVAGMTALQRKLNPVITVKDAHGDPWVHVKMPISAPKKRKEGAQRPQADKPMVKMDSRSRFVHPDDVRRGYHREWRPGGTGSMESVIQRFEKEKSLQEFLKNEEHRGAVPLSERKRAKDWEATHHEVWDPNTHTKKRDATGNTLTAEDAVTNAIERGDMGTWKWNDEDRGYDTTNEYGEKDRHYVKRGSHLDFDSHHDRRKVMTALLHENFGRLYGKAVEVLKKYGRLSNNPEQKHNDISELINHAYGKAFHDSVDSYNPHNVGHEGQSARLSTHLVNRSGRAMEEHLPNLGSVPTEEAIRIRERRKDVRAFRPKTEFGPSVRETAKPEGEGESQGVDEAVEPRSRRGRSAGHGLVQGGVGGMMGSGYQMDPEQSLQYKRYVEEHGLPADEDEPAKPEKPEWLGQAPKKKEPAGPAASAAPGQRQAYVSGHSDPSVYEPEHGQPGMDEDEWGGRGGKFRRSLVAVSVSTLCKALDAPEASEEGNSQPKYLWREGEPGAHKHMWEGPNGDVVRMTNAPEGHPHHDPELGPPQLHPNEPTPQTAPHMFDKHGRKLHRPVPDGVESEHNDHYDPDVNNWVERYQDPDTGDDEHIYLHKDRVKDHRLKFNEDLRHADAQLEKVRQWYKQLLSTPDPVHRAIGLAAALMDQAKMASDGTDSGLLSLKVGDVKPSGNTVSFTYRDAKGGAHHAQVVMDNTIGTALHELMQGKKSTDPLFMVQGQRLEQPMLAKIFDDQFGISPNHLRVFHGTEMFSKEFQNQAATTPNLGPEHLPKIANKTYGRVARMMGHLTMSPKLAQQMYVDPVAVESLYMSAVHHHHPEFNKSKNQEEEKENFGEVSRLVFQGLPISIENPVGSVRKWHNKHTGESGQTKMLYPYGYIRDTTGTDNGEVDVYIGPHRNSDRVFVVHQMKGPTFKEYDEDKVMLGFRTPDEAREAYLKHYDDPRFFGSMTTMSMREFKNKVFATKKHPHMVTTDKIPGGLSEGKPDTDFDFDDVMEGLKVEMEHTDDPSIAYEITKDHLTEDRKYYKKLKKIEKAFEPHRPSEKTETENGYVYHATNEDNARDIAGSHLKPHRPWHGTDQSTWPDGSTEKRSYWSNKASAVHSFAPAEGKSVILRTKQADHFKPERGTGDVVTTKKVHSNDLEIKHKDGSWHPLNHVYGSGEMGKSFSVRSRGAEVGDVDNINSMHRPGHAYRGMTHEEYHATVGAGKGVKSRGDYSHSSEGTSFADHPDVAESYVNFGRDDPRKTGKPNYMVEVKQDHLQRDKRDGYLKAKVGAEIPREHITRVWKMHPHDGAVHATMIHGEETKKSIIGDHYSETKRLSNMMPDHYRQKLRDSDDGLPEEHGPYAHLREPIAAHQYAAHMHGVAGRDPSKRGEAKEASDHAWKQSDGLGGINKSQTQRQPDPYVWHVSVSHPDRSPEEEAFSKWVHGHPMHEHDQQWAAFKLATKVPDVPIPDPRREYADGSNQLLDNVEDNPHMEQEESAPPAQAQDLSVKSLLDSMIRRVA